MTDPDLRLSRVADPRATATDTLPDGCRCPGAPHETDTFTYRTELGAGERNALKVAGWAASDYAYYDFEAANDAAIAKMVVSWDLTGPERCDHRGPAHAPGEPLPANHQATSDPVPINRTTASLLDERTRVAILEKINAAFEAFTEASLPNGSGAPSADSSQASASPNRASRRRRSSTKG